MSSKKKLAATGQRKGAEHEGIAAQAPSGSIRPARVDRVPCFSMSIEVHPQSLGDVLSALDDMRGVDIVTFHGMSIVIESTDEVL